MTALLGGLLLSAFCALPAHALTVRAAISQDGSFDTAYRAGDKPIDPGSTPPSAWTVATKGTGFGEIDELSATSFEVVAGGSDDEGDYIYAHQSCGTGDCEVTGRIPDTASWLGVKETFTSFFVGITEGTGDSAWQIQAWMTPDGRPRCKAGAPGPDDYNSTGDPGASSEYLRITRDADQNDYGCWQSDDGSVFTRYGTFLRTTASALGYFGGTSHDINATTTATLTDVDFSTTLSDTPTDPPDPPDPPNNAPVCSAIPNQTVAVGTVFSLNASQYCVDGDAGDVLTFSTNDLSSRGLSINSSTGLISGILSGAAGTFNITVTATDQGGASDSDTFQVTAQVQSGTGDVFTIPDVGDTTDSTYNCGSATATSGVSWASIRTVSGSPAGDRPGPGDQVLVSQGTRGDTRFNTCQGTSSAKILFAKTVGTSQLIINGNNQSEGAGAFFFDDSINYVVDGLINWTGHTGGCGANKTAAGISATPLNDCAIKIIGSANNAIRLRGERRGHTHRGIEVDGGCATPNSTNCIETGYFSNDAQYCPLAPALAPTDINDTSTNWVQDTELTDVYFHNLRGTATYHGINIPNRCGPGDLRFTLPNFRRTYWARLYFRDLGSNGVHIKRHPGTDPSTVLVEDSWVGDVGGNSCNNDAGCNNRPYALYESSGTIRNSIAFEGVADDPENSGFYCARQHRPPAFGLQVCKVYNTVTIRPRNHGLQVVHPTGGCCGNTPGMKLEFDNNTVVDPGGNCVNLSTNSDVPTSGWVRNTLCAGSQQITNMSTVTRQGNGSAGNGSTAQQGFVNAGNDDFRLTSGSGNKDAGVNVSCPSTDLLGNPRPRPPGGVCDRGAFEVQ